MVKKVWQSDDGKIFRSEEEAITYENSLKEMSFRQWASNGRYVVSGSKAIRFKDGVAIFGYHQTKEKTIGYYDNSSEHNARQDKIDADYQRFKEREALEESNRRSGPFAYSDSDYDNCDKWP